MGGVRDIVTAEREDSIEESSEEPTSKRQRICWFDSYIMLQIRCLEGRMWSIVKAWNKLYLYPKWIHGQDGWRERYSVPVHRQCCIPFCIDTLHKNVRFCLLLYKNHTYHKHVFLLLNKKQKQYNMFISNEYLHRNFNNHEMEELFFLPFGRSPAPFPWFVPSPLCSVNLFVKGFFSGFQLFLYRWFHFLDFLC